MNNFQLLEKEMAQGKEQRFTKIRKDLNETRGLFQMIGDLVDLFFPKLIDTFVAMSGPSVKTESQSKYPHEK